MSRKHIGDYKARRALKAVSTVIKYLNDEESFASNTEWVDTKGYAMDCDLGYFYEGLDNFRDLLIKRLRKAVPRYRQLCEEYFEDSGEGEDD